MLCKYQIQRDEAVPDKVAAFLSRDGLRLLSMPLDLVVLPQSARWFQRLALATLPLTDRIPQKNSAEGGARW